MNCLSTINLLELKLVMKKQKIFLLIIKNELNSKMRLISIVFNKDTI